MVLIVPVIQGTIEYVYLFMSRANASGLSGDVGPSTSRASAWAMRDNANFYVVYLIKYIMFHSTTI